jgi:hypothetical protein
MMLDMKKSDRKIYFTGLKTIAKDKRIRQGEFAQAVGKDQTTISNYINLKTRPPDEYYEVFESILEATRDEIMNTGKKELIQDTNHLPPPPPQPDNLHTLKKHQGILNEFQNQDLALKVNQKLIEAEKVNPNILIEVIGYINGRIKEEQEQKANSTPGPQEKLSGS